MSDIVERDEVCGGCRYAAGPILLWCSNPQSEFYREPVCNDGYCPWFKRPRRALREQEQPA